VSILTQLKSLPTVHNGHAVDPKALKAAIDYATAVQGPTAVRVKWTSDKAKVTRKDHRSKKIESVGTAVAGIGIEHKNLPQNADKETGELKGSTWLLYPYIMISDAEGRIKVRLYPVAETIKSHFIVDGEVKDSKEDKAEVKGWLYARKPSTHDTLTIDVFVENLELL
jgi:hypothetical protein